MSADPSAGLPQFHYPGSACLLCGAQDGILYRVRRSRRRAAGHRGRVETWDQLLSSGLRDHLDLAWHTLAQQNYRHLETFRSEAFAGRRCAFLMSETMQLIELIESGHDIMEAE